MPPLSCTTQTVTTENSESTTSHSLTENMEDPCDKVEDEYVKNSTSDTQSSSTKEQVEVQIVWRNVILFAMLHLASIYSIYLMFTSAKWQTNIFGKYFWFHSIRISFKMLKLEIDWKFVFSASFGPKSEFWWTLFR